LRLQREQWRKANKVDAKTKKKWLLEQAVKDYYADEITQDEYLEIVAKNQPIKPFKEVSITKFRRNKQTHF
jgi:hypothetical protein